MECLKINFLVDTLVTERCAIFCWQAMKMFHLFLTSRNLKYTFKIFQWQRLAANGKSVAVALYIYILS